MQLPKYQKNRYVNIVDIFVGAFILYKNILDYDF